MTEAGAVPPERVRAPTWAQQMDELDAARRTPEHLAFLAAELIAIGQSRGLAAIAMTSTAELVEARVAIDDRVRRDLQSTMAFTFSKPERSTAPSRLINNAKTLIVGAWGYRREDIPSPFDDVLDGEPHLSSSGRIARYQWVDHYALLKAALDPIVQRLEDEGWRARTVIDDNSLVDRAAAHRAGLGWYGKNANLLLPQLGSWFVLGSVVTDAPFVVADQPIADGCGPCARCIPACPTGAIIEPGVIDANKCLAWVVQAPGDIDPSLRVAMHDRIYGCDDCQDACPENRRADKAAPPAAAETNAVPWVALVEMLAATDAELLSGFGRWYLPDRNPDVLRRNAAVALGNIGDPTSPQLISALRQSIDHGSDLVARHSVWALDRLATRLATQTANRSADSSAFSRGSVTDVSTSPE